MRRIVNEGCDKVKREASPWIETTDRLPFENDESDKLVAYKSNYSDTILYGIAWYSEGRWYSEDDSMNTCNIIAWQHIEQYEKD